MTTVDVGGMLGRLMMVADDAGGGGVADRAAEPAADTDDEGDGDVIDV